MPRKGSKPQKGPNRTRIKFSCFIGGDIQKSWAQTKFEAKPVKISPFRTDRTIGPKIAPSPKPLFSGGNWKFGRCQSGDIIQAVELVKFKIRPTPGPKVMGIGILVPKMGQCPKSTMPRPYPEFYWGVLQLWVIQPYPENLGQIHQVNLL